MVASDDRRSATIAASSDRNIDLKVFFSSLLLFSFLLFLLFGRGSSPLPLFCECFILFLILFFLLEVHKQPQAR
ncbi:hypothetical protein CsSME_00019945 [Camellia sinensis var. sinensis]